MMVESKVDKMKSTGLNQPKLGFIEPRSRNVSNLPSNIYRAEYDQSEKIYVAGFILLFGYIFTIIFIFITNLSYFSQVILVDLQVIDNAFTSFQLIILPFIAQILFTSNPIGIFFIACLCWFLAGVLSGMYYGSKGRSGAFYTIIIVFKVFLKALILIFLLGFVLDSFLNLNVTTTNLFIILALSFMLVVSIIPLSIFAHLGNRVGVKLNEVV
jgi:hypothetical protein